MNSRFLTNIVLAFGGGFLIVASQAWSPSVFMWLMLGGGVLAIALGGAAALPHRGAAQRTLDVIAALLGAWTIVAALVFAGTVVTWLGFASGAGFLGLALVGLTLHEVSTERVVHSLEVRGQSSQPTFTDKSEYAAIR
jgi:peptidoglycan/LPS O-acetylase OafA/YrhL